MFFIIFNTHILLQMITFPILFVISVISVGIFTMKRKTRKLSIDEFTLSERIRNYKPRPLVDTEETKFEEKHIIKKSRFNFAKVDYLSFSDDQDLLNDVSDCIKKYGVGTCGPRPFFGSTDVHFSLEEKLAKFLCVEDVIVYSYGFSTVSSSVACYCKPCDIIFIDDLCNIAIRQGISSTKCNSFFFKHNDPRDFLLLVEEIQERYSKCKKILVLEGIYARDGSICLLKDFVEICKKNKIRIFIDESISFGTLGKNGKGVTEYYNVQVNEIDMIIGSLEHALYSIGGFCAGSHPIIEHQRLNSLGYVYSASLPTYSAKAAVIALEDIKNKPLILHTVSLEIDRFLRSINKFEVKSHPDSPLKVFGVKGSRKPVFANKLDRFLRENNVYVVVEDGDIKMNLYVEFGHDRTNFDDLFDIVRRGVEKCLLGGTDVI